MVRLECGCRWTAYNTVAYCSLHGAAPDLLAGLRGIESKANEVITAFDGTLEAPHGVYELRDMARAAIAKAKGQA